MRDAVLGVKWGLSIAAVLTIVAILVVPINGGLVLRTRQGWEINILVIVGLYIVTGVVAGAVAGALRPLLRWRLGAALIGIIGTIPIGVGTIVGRAGPTFWTRSDILTAVFFPLVFGIPMGIILRAFVMHLGNEKNR